MSSTCDAKVARLEHVPLLRGCSARDREVMCRLGDLVRLERGSVLMEQGRFGHEAVVLLDGALTVSRDETVVAVLQPGAVVGEGAVLNGGRRTATVVAATPVELLVFDQRSFTCLLAEVPVVTRRILSELSLRSRQLDPAPVAS